MNNKEPVGSINERSDQEDMYYVCMPFHTPYPVWLTGMNERNGNVTYNIRLAEKYTLEEASLLCLHLNCVGWACSYIDRISEECENGVVCVAPSYLMHGRNLLKS